MNYISRRFQNQKATLTLDTNALSQYHDIIDLSIGDTDFTTDARIIDAACQDALRGHTHYGVPKGDAELIAAVAKAWEEDFAQKVPENEILITASSCMGMGLLMLSCLDPGDEVLVFGPYFAVYKQQIELAGGVCVEVETKAEESYALRRDAVEAALTPRTKLMIINNPVNPTGVVYSRSELEMLACVAREHDLLIAADEIYTRYLYEGEFIPIRTLPGMAERTVTLNSFSKNYMMTGWRVGYVIAPEEIIRTMNLLNGGLVYTAPSVSQRAALKALSLRAEMDALYIDKYKERVLLAADRIAGIPYMSLVRPKGTFYLFPGIEKTGLSSTAFCARALQDAHVLLTPGSAFGKAGEGHIRIACTAPADKLLEAIERLSRLSF